MFIKQPNVRGFVKVNENGQKIYSGNVSYQMEVVVWLLIFVFVTFFFY